MDYPAARFVTQRAGALRSQGMQLGWSRLFKGTTIRGRLTGALAVLLLLWCAASAAMLFEVARIHQRAERIGREHLPRLMRANALIDQANLTARLMGEMQLVDDPVRARQRIDRIMVIRRQVADEMRWFEAHSGRDEVQRLLAGIATQRLHYWAGQDRLFALVQQDPLAARAYYLADVLGLQQGYVQMLGQLIDLENAHADATAARTRVEYERTLYLLMGVSGMMLLLAGVVGIAVLRSITEPLEDAAVWARVVAQGNLDAEPAVGGRDEVGQLAAALRQMAGSLRLDRARRQATERALRESRAQLRQWVTHAEYLQEHERLTLARELHDELGQSITALRMELGLMRMRFGGLDPALAPQVTRSKAILDAMLRSMRSMVSTLRPGPLDEGLVPAAEWLLATLPERAGLACTLAAPADLPTGQAVRTAAFRILQEALTNVVRHAHARSVRVVITHDEAGRLQLQVIDDGVGVDPEILSRARSFGVVGMRERARAFGGWIDFRETAGGGTTLLAVLDACAEHVGDGEAADAGTLAPGVAGSIKTGVAICRDRGVDAEPAPCRTVATPEQKQWGAAT